MIGVACYDDPVFHPVPTTSFTGELIALTRSGIPDAPPDLTLNTIYPNLRQRLLALGLPQPSQRGADTADRYVFASNAYHQGERQPPTQAAAWRDRADKWCEQDRYEEAEAAYREAICLNPDSADAHVGLALAWDFRNASPRQKLLAGKRSASTPPLPGLISALVAFFRSMDNWQKRKLLTGRRSASRQPIPTNRATVDQETATMRRLLRMQLAPRRPTVAPYRPGATILTW